MGEPGHWQNMGRIARRTLLRIGSRTPRSEHSKLGGIHVTPSGTWKKSKRCPILPDRAALAASRSPIPACIWSVPDGCPRQGSGLRCGTRARPDRSSAQEHRISIRPACCAMLPRPRRRASRSAPVEARGHVPPRRVEIGAPGLAKSPGAPIGRKAQRDQKFTRTLAP